MKKTYAIAFITGFISIFIWCLTNISNSEDFDEQCNNHIKAAVNASTLDVAYDQLQIAVNYCKDNGLTSGYISNGPFLEKEDIGLWYTTLKKSLITLNALPSNATLIEKNRVFTELRETLGVDRCPRGISAYPYNTEYSLWIILSMIITLLAGVAYLASK